MRVVRLNTPTGIGGLGFSEALTPSPGPGQVLVKMRAASLNYRDLLVANGRYGGGVVEGLIPGSDGAGEVVEIGQDVHQVKVGDRVCGTFYQSWQRGPMVPQDNLTALGGSIDGVLAEYRVFDQEGVIPFPDHLSFEEAACLPCAAVTVWSAFYDLIPIRAGQTVLTLGTGGVSIFAIQFAKIAGLRIISTSSSEEKLARLRDEFGVTDTINYRQHEKWETEVLRLTGGVGVDHVIETGGPGTLARSIASTRMNGFVHLIGVLTSGTINPLSILRRLIVRGVLVGSRDSFAQMNAAITVSGLKPVIDKSYAFGDTIAAYQALESANHLGKIVISMD